LLTALSGLTALLWSTKPTKHQVMRLIDERALQIVKELRAEAGDKRDDLLELLTSWRVDDNKVHEERYREMREHFQRIETAVKAPTLRRA